MISPKKFEGVEAVVSEEKKLEMFGGVWGGLIPMFILVCSIVWLSVEERGGTQAFWAGGWIAIAVGLFFAKNKSDYCGAVMRGLGDKNGIVIITAWIFAGVFGRLMVSGGLIEGLLWVGLETGAQGALFTVLAFVAAMLFALGTGTSSGTVLALIPVLYPAGVFLGANPTMLAAGILSGAAFGDNLAPVSDTTIVSAFTQEATMRDVVRSRFPLSMSAAVISMVILFIFGGGGTISNLPALKAQINPAGLLMLISFAVVVASALAGRHIVESLIYGNVSAVIFGLLNGKLKLSTLYSLPAKRGQSTGLIEAGISGVVGAILFALFVLAVTQILIESGVMEKILKWAEKTVSRTVTQAEAVIVAITILVSIPIAANAPSLMLVGPSLVKPLGKKFNLSPARRANLMDCAVCTIFFTIPWHIAVIVWYGALTSAAQQWNLPLPSIGTAALNPYSWALLAVLIFSVATGWNREFEKPSLNE